VRQAVDVPVCVQPTAYDLEPGAVYNREIVVPGLWTTVEPRGLSRFVAAEYAAEAAGIGIEFIGGCCGMLPYHIRAMAEALGKSTALPDRERGYSLDSP
jgi:betaine-homocysteine S-methyltransferase